MPAPSADAAAIAAATLTQTMVLGRRLARGDTRVTPPSAQTVATIYREFFDLIQEGDAVDLDAWIASHKGG